jgi:hypothetical protein
MVASVFERVPLDISFGRTLSGQNLIVWHQLVSSIKHIQLTNTNDLFRWNIMTNGIFNV